MVISINFHCPTISFNPCPKQTPHYKEFSMRSLLVLALKETGTPLHWFSCSALEIVILFDSAILLLGHEQRFVTKGGFHSIIYNS